MPERPEPDLLALGTHIRRLREERGLTQEQLAEAAGITSRGLMYIEHGRRDPGYRTLVRIAAGLKLALVIPIPGSSAARPSNGAT